MKLEWVTTRTEETEDGTEVTGAKAVWKAYPYGREFKLEVRQMRDTGHDYVYCFCWAFGNGVPQPIIVGWLFVDTMEEAKPEAVRNVQEWFSDTAKHMAEIEA